MLQLELTKALHGRPFRFSLAAGLLIAFFHLATIAIPYAFGPEWGFMRDGAGGTYPPGLFNSWIGGTPFSIASTLFFYCSPLLFCIPYASSLFEEMDSGLAAQIMSRSGRGAYFSSKLAACYLSGLVAYFFPLGANLLGAALLLPALKPEACAGTFFVAPNALFADVFFSHPFVYLALFLLMSAAIFAVVALGAMLGSFVFPNKLLVTCTPFMLCIILNAALQPLGLSQYAPCELLNPSPTGVVQLAPMLAAYCSSCALLAILYVEACHHLELA